MPDKDDFTFDDNDDFPETDLSSAFEESEQHAPEEPEPQPAKGNNSKTRPLLLVLLLVIALAGGAYYFMGLGGTEPEVAKAPEKTKKTVALPPKPAKVPASKPAVKPAEKQAVTQDVATVAVPPPPTKETAKPEAPVPAPAEAKTEPAEEPKAVVEAPAKEEGSKAVAPVPAAEVVAVSVPAAEAPEVTAPAPTASGSVAVVEGTYALDAGSFLLASNRKNLEKKIRALGYDPLVTPIEAKVAMTRLRLGTFSESEAKDALAYARQIAPSSFSIRDGDQYVLYAGTFFNQQNVDLLYEQFLMEGITAKKEQVEVVRTLNRVRFGSFASQEEAAKASAEVAAAGIESKVVKFK